MPSRRPAWASHEENKLLAVLCSPGCSQVDAEQQCSKGNECTGISQIDHTGQIDIDAEHGNKSQQNAHQAFTGDHTGSIEHTGLDHLVLDE